MIDLESNEQRVLILTPLGKDAQLTQEILRGAGIYSEICNCVRDLIAKLDQSFGAILIAEEVFDSEAVIRDVNSALKQQPPWSDIPLVLLTKQGEATEASTRLWGAFAATGNVTILERPVRTSTLISALQVALRARRRQYQVKRLLEEQKAATLLRDEFISIASHELKTPITSIQLQLQLNERHIEREKENFSLERMHKFFRGTGSQVNKLVRLIEDMLDVSRIHAGKFSIRREEFDLSELVQEVIDRMRDQLSSVGCSVFFSSEKCVGSWDRYRIEQVIINLLTNAMRYAPGTSVKIGLKTNDATLTLTCEDEGPGIPEENLERVFERFERGPGSSKSIAGLGLGLYICRQIAEAHGGQIRAVRKEGPGARFEMKMPLRPVNAVPLLPQGNFANPVA